MTLGKVGCIYQFPVASVLGLSLETLSWKAGLSWITTLFLLFLSYCCSRLWWCWWPWGWWWRRCWQKSSMLSAYPCWHAVSSAWHLASHLTLTLQPREASAINPLCWVRKTVTQKKPSHFLEASGQASESPAGLLNHRLPGPVLVPGVSDSAGLWLSGRSCIS